MNTATPGKAKILVVEDHPFMRELLRRLLSTSYDTALVESGEEAMYHLRWTGIPDLIICDLNDDEVSGLELIRQLKANPAFRDIPVIVFSVDAYPEAKNHYLSAGAAAFFTKPFDFSVIEKQIQVLVSRTPA